MDGSTGSPADELDDAALMHRVVARDQVAFRQQADRHVGRIIAVAQRMLGNAAEADEIAQETLFRVWQHASRWDAFRAAPGPWMFRIACNLCIDRSRRRIFHPLDAAEDVADPLPSAIDVLVDHEQRNRLAAALASLPARQRAAIVLFYQQEMGGTETAAALGVSQQGLWSLLLRGRRSLARALGD